MDNLYTWISAHTPSNKIMRGGVLLLSLIRVMSRGTINIILFYQLLRVKVSLMVYLAMLEIIYQIQPQIKLYLESLIWVLSRQTRARTPRNCKIKNFPGSQIGHMILRKINAINAKSRKYGIQRKYVQTGWQFITQHDNIIRNRYEFNEFG